MKQFYFLNFVKIFTIVFVALSSIHLIFAQDGSIDSGFNASPSFNQDVFSTAVQTDGKIVVVGNFTPTVGTEGFRIARLNADGTTDGTFKSGTGFNNDVRGVTLQADGKIIVVGEFTKYNDVIRNRIVRINTDGSIDTTFDAGVGFSFYAFVPIVQPDGKIIVVGSFTGTSRNYIARLNADGTLDATFNTGSGFNEAVYTATRQPDGKILVGGNFSSYNGVARAKIARLNADGTLDTTFSSGTTGFNNFVFAIDVQADNKIIIGGWFTAYNGTSRRGIARLNADGILDTTFNPGNGFNGNGYVTKIQTDGKIIVGGDYTSFNGTARNNIARLNANGTLDTSFTVGTGFNSYVRSLSIQPDGKVIAGGFFTSYNGTNRSRMARLNVPSLDTQKRRIIKFDYYPNPTTDYLHVKSSETIHKITICNLIGQEIKKFTLSSKDVSLNIHDLSIATYLVTISSHESTESFKIIKN